jgi:hypothetical protein
MMSLPTGRGDQRVRSCGRAKKRDDAGRPRTMGRGRGKVADLIKVPLSKDGTGCDSVMVNGREHSAAEQACQGKIVGHPPHDEARWVGLHSDESSGVRGALPLMAMWGLCRGQPYHWGRCPGSSPQKRIADPPPLSSPGLPRSRCDIVRGV